MKSQPKKDLTFLWIPDASRPVKFIRLRKSVLWLLSSFTAIMIASSVYYHLFTDSLTVETKQKEIVELKQQLNHANEQFYENITNKDEYIADLQQEVFTLTEQVEKVQLRLHELQVLEQELLKLTSMNGDAHESKALAASDLPQSSDAMIASAKTYRVSAASDQALKAQLGGTLESPKPQHWIELADHAKDSLQEIQDEISGLSGQFANIKSELLEMERRQRYTPSIRPSKSKVISSGYGIRRDPFTKALSFHNGTDFAGKTGDPVYASADGSVLTVGENGTRGKYILLEHDYGFQTMYMHLSAIHVKKGEVIKKGDQIGDMGTTGRSTGPHLHYEVWKNNTPVNPAPYFD